jgi:hypothetical protein
MDVLTNSCDVGSELHNSITDSVMDALSVSNCVQEKRNDEISTSVMDAITTSMSKMTTGMPYNVRGNDDYTMRGGSSNNSLPSGGRDYQRESRRSELFDLVGRGVGRNRAREDGGTFYHQWNRAREERDRPPDREVGRTRQREYSDEFYRSREGRRGRNDAGSMSSNTNTSIRDRTLFKLEESRPDGSGFVSRPGPHSSVSDTDISRTTHTSTGRTSHSGVKHEHTSPGTPYARVKTEHPASHSVVPDTSVPDKFHTSAGRTSHSGASQGRVANFGGYGSVYNHRSRQMSPKSIEQNERFAEMKKKEMAYLQKEYDEDELCRKKEKDRMEEEAAKASVQKLFEAVAAQKDLDNVAKGNKERERAKVASLVDLQARAQLRKEKILSKAGIRKEEKNSHEGLQELARNPPENHKRVPVRPERFVVPEGSQYPARENLGRLPSTFTQQFVWGERTNR